MTGFGDARHERADHALSAEVRTINSRHFKLNLRTTEGYGALDARIEAVVREYVRRGTVNVNIRIRHISPADDYRVNADVLENYLDQLQKVAAKRGLRRGAAARAARAAARRHRRAVDRGPRRRSHLAAVGTDAARRRSRSSARCASAEGQALAADLASQCAAVEASLNKIADALAA